MQGPYTRVVIRRPNGRTEVIGRSGHLDHHKASREFSNRGEVVAVRHEMADSGRGRSVAIHPLKQ